MMKTDKSPQNNLLLKVLIVVSAFLGLLSVLYPFIIADLVFAITGNEGSIITVFTVVVVLFFISGGAMTVVFLLKGDSLIKSERQSIAIRALSNDEISSSMERVLLENGYLKECYDLELASVTLFIKDAFANERMVLLVTLKNEEVEANIVLNPVFQDKTKIVSTMSSNFGVTVMFFVNDEKEKLFSHLEEMNIQSYGCAKLTAVIDVSERQIVYDRILDGLGVAKQRKLEKELSQMLFQANCL